MRGRDNENAELNIMAIAQWSIRDEGLAIIIIIISGPMGYFYPFGIRRAFPIF